MARFLAVMLATLLAMPAQACDEAEEAAKRTELEELMREVLSKDLGKALDFAVMLERRRQELDGKEEGNPCQLYDELLKELKAMQ